MRLHSLRFNFGVTIIILMIFNSIDSIKFPTWPLNLISSYEPMKSIFAPRADHMQFSTPPCEVWRLSAFISSSNAQLFIQQYSCGLRVKTDSQTSECSKLHRYGIHQYLIQERTNTLARNLSISSPIYKMLPSSKKNGSLFTPPPQMKG